MNWLAIILGFVVAIDHTLAAIPSIGANSTFQLISKLIIMMSGMAPASTQSQQKIK